VVDNPSFILQFSSHVPVTVAAKLLGEGLFDILYYHRIFKELPILVNTMGTGPYPFGLEGPLVIKATGLKTCPGE
jgi:hypothetical protein